MKSFEVVLKRSLETVVQRLKEYDESPDPTVLRSDKLLDELQKERFELLLDTCQRGKPSVEAEFALGRITRAMGLERYAFPEMVDDARGYAQYKAVLERRGFPEQCCERAIAQVGMFELGELPIPTVMLNENCGCDADAHHRTTLAKMYNIPVFFIDIPLNEDDKPSLESLNYIVDQIWEFIEWAEKKVPGAKYDESILIEQLEMDAIGDKYRREIYDLAKHVPCPVGPLGLKKRLLHFLPSRYPNMKKGIEYLRTCRDEIGEVVASGKGPYDEERLRLLWSGQIALSEVIDPRKILLERKIAMPVYVGNPIGTMPGIRFQPIGEMSEYGIKLSPIQEAARRADFQFWGGAGKRWSNLTLDVARDIGAQGIIHYLVLGCTPMKSMGAVVADRAEKELGIPTLNIEGRIQDKDYMSQERFEELLLPFINKCFDWAKKRQK